MIGPNTYVGNVIRFNVKPNPKADGQKILEITVKCDTWHRGKSITRFIKASILDKRAETYSERLSPGIPVSFTGFDNPWPTTRKKDTQQNKAGELMVIHNVEVEQFQFIDYPGKTSQKDTQTPDSEEHNGDDSQDSQDHNN